MRILLFVLFLVFFALSSSFAQKHDNIWFSAYKYLNPTPDGNFLDFSAFPPKATASPVLFESRGSVTAMSDEKGEMLFYCNGIRIANAEHDIMMNGDSINWSEFASYQIDQGYASPYSLIALPGFSAKQFFLVYQQAQSHPNLGLYIPEILYSEIDMSRDNGLGAVVKKDKHLMNTFRADGPNAVRHGNGRDWWVLAPEHFRSLYHGMRLSPEGFTDYSAQAVGSKPDSLTRPDGGGQNVFSPDGSIYVDYDSWNGIRIFDFDRCTGQLSEREIIDFAEKRGFGAGAAISPNSRFLYVTSSDRIFQYDLWADNIAASEDTVATWDGFYSPSPPFATSFYSMQLGPDGRIYCVPTNGVYHLHYIEHPDLKGDSCKVVQHGLQLPHVIARSLPVHPNYRLYDLQGSPCDTLGINGYVSAVEPEPLPPLGDDGIHLAPNPASTFATLEVQTAWTNEGPVQYQLLNLLGIVVRTGTIEAGVSYTSLSLSGLPSGLYVCQVADKDRVLGTAKLSVIKN